MFSVVLLLIGLLSVYFAFKAFKNKHWVGGIVLILVALFFTGGSYTVATQNDSNSSQQSSQHQQRPNVVGGKINKRLVTNEDDGLCYEDKNNTDLRYYVNDDKVINSAVFNYQGNSDPDTTKDIKSVTANDVKKTGDDEYYSSKTGRHYHVTITQNGSETTRMAVGLLQK